MHVSISGIRSNLIIRNRNLDLDFYVEVGAFIMHAMDLSTKMTLCPLTIACDEEDLSLSWETWENSGGVIVSIDLRPKCSDSKLWLSKSE